MKPRIFLLVPTFHPHDAVGNDVFGMYKILRSAGYETTVLAESVHSAHESYTSLVRLDAEYWQDPNAILIYHHAIDWRLGEKILKRSKNKIVIKYHNVTPPEFFANYSQNYYWACTEGVAATKRLAAMRIDFVWGDSQFNANEFIRLGVAAGRCRVLPPIHVVEDIARQPLDSVVLGAYRGATPNILFVGALRPNKGHFKALETFAAYRKLSAKQARLIFVGRCDPLLDQYVEELKCFAHYLEIGDSLVLADSVTPSQLRAYYTLASAFLCVSEHEGFCVPLVEAMFFRVPIVAWAATAVGETSDGCGMIYDQYNAGVLAHAIHDCIENPERARCLASKGRLRYETVFQPKAIEAGLLRLVAEVERA